MSQYLLTIDQGTTSSRAILFNTQGELCFVAQEEFEQHYPSDGWVEHAPSDLWHSVQRTCQAVLKDNAIAADDIIGIGITNQRETTLVWDKTTGEPLYNAIVWQDRRTASYCQELLSEEPTLEQDIAARTGLLLDPYFSATKIRWILDHVAGAQQKAERGELAFGTVDTYLLWHLTGGKVHRTDATNASRTMLFNIHKQQWDKALLHRFRIPEDMLPDVMDCAAHYGDTEHSLLGQSLPILAMVGDQQAALIGQCCFEPGMAKSTYGTGCFMMLNTGDKALQSKSRLLSTVAYRLNGNTRYALEGSIFMAGATIQWLRDGLQLISNASETESLAYETPQDHGVFLVPAFTGLGAPYWDPNARGAIFGLTRDTGIKEIVTAGLQSVCYQTKDLQKAMEQDGQRPTAIRVDGGMVANNWLMAYLADILGADVERPYVTETTALGAAFLVGLQAGTYDSLEDIAKLWHQERRFTPTMSKAQRDGFYHRWQDAVARVQQSGTT